MFNVYIRDDKPLNHQRKEFYMSDTVTPKVSPSVCTWHNGSKYVVEVALPGVTKKEIKVGVTDKSFCVATHGTPVVYSCGFALAHPIDPEFSKAEFKNGMLTLTLPFKESLEPTILKVE
jgi:HSP20 family molecular chaperone IbpA